MKVPKLGTKEVTVGDIDLSSNQLLEFLENFTEEKEQKTAKFDSNLLVILSGFK